MPTRRLPSSPDLDHLKHQARDLRAARRDGRADACQRIREFHPRFARATDAAIASAPFTLADALFTIAREYGFPSWARLRSHAAGTDRARLDLPIHERITDAGFRRALDLLDDGDEAGLRGFLAAEPDLVRRREVFEGENYFRDPTLLEFVAENPVRHDSLPPNIVDVTRVILDAGAAADRRAVESTLGLVCSGRVARECGAQVPLIDLLCDRGASPDGAMLAALTHGEFEAVDALIRRGATIDLVVAAATGRVEKVRRILPGADGTARHRAVALAAQHGQEATLSILLDAGEDPDRYNPAGCHAHSTPLHQAALAGHEGIVRLLVERGAGLDIRDLHWHATPLGWAQHAGKETVAAYLLSHGAST